MLKTHIKLAFRNLAKYPVFSAINLGGLALGIAASFILLVYTQRELGCDRGWKDADRIVRIGTDFFNVGGFAMSQPMLRDLMRYSCKDVQYATALQRYEDALPVRTSLQERAFKEISPYYVDSAFFKVFSYEARQGSIPQNGLQPDEVILSAALATKFFGKDYPVGKTLLMGEGNRPFKVVAVLRNISGKSHLDPQMIMAAQPLGTDQNWNSCAVYNYVKLQPAASMTGLNSWLDWLTKSIHKRKENATVKFIPQPLTGIYFHSPLFLDLSPGGNLTQVRLLSAISIFMILLAVINYVNLVTARASTRSREIGVKKTFGASRMHLATQIMMESLVFSLLAMILSCGLIQVLLFTYEATTGATLTGAIPLIAAHYGWLLLFSLGVGFIAGIYPAFYLTAFRPILSLRALKAVPGKTDPRVRNGLVMVQFTIAAALVFISFVIHNQLQYMDSKDKGLHTDGVVMIQGVDRLGTKALAFQQMVERQSQVAATSFCNRAPATETVWMGTYRTATMHNDLTIQQFPVDDRFISTLGIRLLNGRNFDKRLVTDTNSLILNESAVAALGLFDPIGAMINGNKRVIGVVKDFNFTTLRQKIEPVIMLYYPAGNTLAVRCKTGHNGPLLAWLEKTCKELSPKEPLGITFLDENFRQLTAKDALLGKTIGFFTVLAILLSVLGLTGLTLFTIERRRKEIGIRKVLGAGYADILQVVAGSFTRIAALATLVALPLSWYIVNRWLQNFAYRTSVSIWTFFLTEMVILAIAFSVIGLLTLVAVIANPVKTLRTE